MAICRFLSVVEYEFNVNKSINMSITRTQNQSLLCSTPFLAEFS